MPWSEAYLRTCPEGHKYPPKERSCPECSPSPETYLQRALSAQGGGGRLSYTGRELAGGTEVLTISTLTLLPGQEPPVGDWDIWLIKGDRRTGKTFAGARWLLAQALAAPEGSLWAVCGPAYLQARFSLEALIARAAPGDIESYAKATLDVTLRNKALIKGFSSESSASMRGYSLAGAWFDDAGYMRYYSFYRDGLLPSLRAGKKPRLVITAGRNRFGLIRDLEEQAEAGDEGVVVTRLAEPIP